MWKEERSTNMARMGLTYVDCKYSEFYSTNQYFDNGDIFMNIFYAFLTTPNLLFSFNIMGSPIPGKMQKCSIVDCVYRWLA